MLHSHPKSHTLIWHFHVRFSFSFSSFKTKRSSLSLNHLSRSSSSLSSRRLMLGTTESGRPATASWDMDDWERRRDCRTTGSGRPDVLASARQAESRSVGRPGSGRSRPERPDPDQPAGIWSFPGQNYRIPAVPRPDSGLLAGERVAEWSGLGCFGLCVCVCFFFLF
jgi:hypothetical protein